MKVSVRDCARRRDEKFLITFRLPGATTDSSAISDREYREGDSVVVKDGRVIR